MARTMTTTIKQQESRYEQLALPVNTFIESHTGCLTALSDLSNVNHTKTIIGANTPQKTAIALTLDGSRRKDKIRWDKDKKSFVYKSNGQRLPDNALYKIVREEVNRIEKKIEKTTNQMLGGRISFVQWQSDMKDHIKNGHVNMARLGRGGKENTFAIHYLDVATELRQNQYPRLRAFSQDIMDGKLTERQIRNRAKLYGLSTKGSFEEARLTLYSSQDKVMLGRRRLGGCSPHCASCLRYASFGWIGLDLIIPPGKKCECGGHCCCSVEIKAVG